MGQNPSFTWRSIFATQSILREKARLWIGKGDSVRIWGQPWLLDLANPFVETNPPAEWINATVSSLKHPDGTQWDFDLIIEVFNEMDVNCILATPMSSDHKMIISIGEMRNLVIILLIVDTT